MVNTLRVDCCSKRSIPASEATLQAVHEAIEWSYHASLRDGSELMAYLVIEALLVRLLNLESLYVDISWDYTLSELFSTSLTGVPSSGRLPKLKNFGFSSGKYGSLNYPLDLLHRTQVESLQIYTCHHTRILEEIWPQTGCAAIKSVELVHWAFSRDMLECILRHCRELVEFTYTVDSIRTVVDTRITIAQTIGLLQAHKDTLQYLRLCVNANWPNGDWGNNIEYDIDETDTISSTIIFKHLRKLFIDRFDLTRALRGDADEAFEHTWQNQASQPFWETARPVTPENSFEKLPRSLEVLGIFRVTTSIVPILEQGPQTISTILPNLRVVRFVPRHEDELEDIKEKCQPVEVAYKYKDLHVSYDE